MYVRQLAVLAAIASLTGCTTPTQARFDAEVDRLCAIDGGNHVFETVVLPSNRFDKQGYPDFMSFKDGKMTLGADFLARNTLTELSTHGDNGPSLRKYVFEVERVSDYKVLGRKVFYFRLGGDAISLLPSGHDCGSPKADILKQIFLPKE